jgi:hypothetical protein
MEPLDVLNPQATGGVKLVKLPDGSIKAEGATPQKTDYVLLADTKLAGITGVLLEASRWPTKRLSARDARTDGNFVLSQFIVKTGALWRARAGR